jgi:hypothetical protein
MNNIEILNMIAGFFPWGFIKVLVLLLCFIYIFFFAIIVRQESLMSKVMEIPFVPVLRILILINFIAAIATFFLSLLLL